MISTDLISAVRDARRKAQGWREERAKVWAEFEKAHIFLTSAVALSDQEQKLAEDTLRQAILDEYALTGNKAPAPGCGVRVLKKLTYKEQQALVWALEHQIALKLDKQSFEGIVKLDAPAFPWVAITDEPQATIAQDLDKALAEK